MSKKVIVDLFYDVISPYSWATFEALTRCNKKCDHMSLRLQPVLLGALFKGVRSKPNGLKAKRIYMKTDLESLGEYFNLPYNMPQAMDYVMFRKGSLSMQRLLIAVNKYSPKLLEEVSREMFLRIWSKDQDATSVESLRVTLHNAGISERKSEFLLHATKEEDIKRILKNNTKLAIGQGVFGVPTYVAHFRTGPELFFGSDQLFLLAYYLNITFPDYFLS
ncbi:glutathione S-transferase kappa 1-like isoform X1 [Clavelina lepadiformis]|uniref:glutathione S-transferase kappa 1-like isoform X1 n=1 Tax=Clavelina lepadiformis TaxID=159417 RepID=UPI0040418BD4